MGTYAMSETSAFGGGSMRFNHSSVNLGHSLELGFSDLAEADVATVRAHYYGQQGGYVSFLLPDVIWLGQTTTTDVVPSTNRWVYASPPEETAKPGAFYDLAVSLRNVGAEA